MQYRAHYFAESTKSSYRTHRNTYFRFCASMGYDPVPVNPERLCQYTAFLARSLCVSSINLYLNVIGILHRQFGLPNPLINNWPLKTLLTGFRRSNSHPSHQKLPITPNLNMSCSFDASFWAICLVAFSGMFRKSHLLPTSTSAFDATKQLTKDDFQFFTWGAQLTIRWSKTIQFRERVVRIPLPLIPYSIPHFAQLQYVHVHFTLRISLQGHLKHSIGYTRLLCPFRLSPIIHFLLNYGG